MDLTETAYTQALRDAQPPPERPRPLPGALPSYMPPPKAAYDRTLASNFFQEFSRCTRQAILLEARLDSGAYDNATVIPLITDRVRRTRETPRAAPAEPRQPSDETRIHHECLEDEVLACDLDDPDETLQTFTEKLETTIARTRAAGLDLCRKPDPSPSPRHAATNPPELKQIAQSPIHQPAQARHRARNPARHPPPQDVRLLE